MDSIYRIERILSGVFERRTTPRQRCRFEDDVQDFITGSVCPIDPSTNTPANNILLKLFGIACNEALASAGRPRVPGSDWSPDYSINGGLLQMINTTSDHLVQVFDCPRSLSIADPGIRYSKCGLPVVPPAGFTAFQGSRPGSIDYFVNATARQDLNSLSGSGAFFVTPIEYGFVAAAVVGTEQLQIGNLQHTIARLPSPSGILQHRVDTGVAVDTPISLWVKFCGRLTFSVNSAIATGFNIWFNMDYAAPSNGTLVYPNPLHLSKSCFLPDVSATRSNSSWQNMYRELLNYAGVAEPKALGTVIPEPFLSSICRIICLMNSLQLG